MKNLGNKFSVFRVLMVAVFVAVAGYGVYTNQKTETMSDMMLANVEALASGESSGSVDCCNNDCNGDFCGTFYPANGSGVGIKMYYK